MFTIFRIVRFVRLVLLLRLVVCVCDMYFFYRVAKEELAGCKGEGHDRTLKAEEGLISALPELLTSPDGTPAVPRRDLTPESDLLRAGVSFFPKR